MRQIQVPETSSDESEKFSAVPTKAQSLNYPGKRSVRNLNELREVNGEKNLTNLTRKIEGNSSKRIKPNKQVEDQHTDDGSRESLQYSSSGSLHLRLSNTIQRNININRQLRIREEWCKIFRQPQKEQIANTIPARNYTQVKLKVMDIENLSFGDDINTPSDSVKILFHNINGIKDEANWYQIITTMMELQVDIFGFAEINRTLDHGKKFKWTDITRKYFYYNRSVHSESRIKMELYKPGGTITTVTGKWQSRITEMGQDKRGLGRWNFIKISSNKKQIIIITAYHPCVTQGPSMTWMQQWTILREEGNKNLDPVKTFYADLESQLQE
jgi:hypothetical protein